MKKSINIILLGIAIFSSELSHANDIYIMGNVNEDDCEMIKKLVATINLSFKPKTIALFYGSQQRPFFSYKKKSRNSDPDLASALNSITGGQRIRITAGDVSQKEKSINSFYKYQRSILYYNKLENPQPPSIFNDFNKLLLFVKATYNKKEKFVYLLVFNKEKPSVTIQAPSSGVNVISNNVQGISTGRSPISEVIVRLNKGEWVKATGTVIWTATLNWINGANTIEAIAIDNENDSSNIAIAKEINFKPKQIDVLSIKYMYPNEKENVVQKCITSNNAKSFKIKFSLEDALINENNLILVVVSPKGLVEKYPLVNNITRATNKGVYSRDFCFYGGYNIATKGEPCDIFLEDNYYIYFEYYEDEKLLLTTKKLLVHFSSFDPNPTTIIRDCNCD